MKAKFLAAFAAVAAITFAGFSASAQYNSTPGIVMAGSQNVDKLPSKAKKFIKKHFDGVGVAGCEEAFAQGKYAVELLNGVEIEFDSKGEVLEVDAPDNTYLAASVAKDLLHDSAFNHLEKAGLIGKVESIEFKKGRAVEVEVDVPGPDTYVFDINGLFITVQD
ncbi:MAG: hypothetical protein HDS61_00635 [Barnesiella sp.]|nr:hypothetical protein [Barnesiella sp.]